MFRQANTNTQIQEVVCSYRQIQTYRYKNTRGDMFRQANTNTNTKIQESKSSGRQIQIHKYVQACIHKYTNMSRQANTLLSLRASTQEQFDSLLLSLREQGEMSHRLLPTDQQRVT